MEGSKPEKDSDKNSVGNEITSEGTSSGTSFIVNTTSETVSSGDKTSEKGKKKKVKKCLAEIKSLLTSDNTHGTLETLQSFVEKLKSGDQVTGMSTTTGSSSSCIWLPHTSNKYQKPVSKHNESSDVFDSAIECVFQSETNPSTMSEKQLSQLTEKEVHKVYVSMSYFSSIERFLRSDNKVKGSASLESFIEDSIENEKDIDVLSNLPASEAGLPDVHSCNSSTKAILLEEDLEPSNQSPPSTTQWSENQAHQIIINQSPEINILEGGSTLKDGQSPNTCVLKLTEENILKHQILERRNYLKTIAGNKDLKKLYYTINAKSRSFQGVRKRKSGAANLNVKNCENCNKLMKCNGGYPVIPSTKNTSWQPYRMAHLDTISKMECSLPDFSSYSHGAQVGHMFLKEQHQLKNMHFPVYNTSVNVPVDRSSTFRFNLLYPTYQNNMATPSEVDSSIPFRSDFDSAYHSKVASVSQETGSSLSRLGTKNKHHVSPSQNVQASQSSMSSDQNILTQDKGYHSNTGHHSYSGSNKHPPLRKQVEEKVENTNIVDFMSEVSQTSVNPFWLDSVTTTVGNYSEYEINLSDHEDEEKFCQQFASLNQSQQILTQVMQYELDKIDIDVDKESDDSNSLFNPVSKMDLDSKWKTMISHQKEREQNSSSTDSVANAESLMPHSRSNPHPKYRKNKHSSNKNSKKRDAVKVKKIKFSDDIEIPTVVIKTEVNNTLEENASMSDVSKCSFQSNGVKSEPSEGKDSSINDSSSKENTVSGAGYEGSEESIGNNEASSGEDAGINQLYHNKLAVIVIKPEGEESGSVSPESEQLPAVSTGKTGIESVKDAMNMYNVTIADMIEDSKSEFVDSKKQTFNEGNLLSNVGNGDSGFLSSTRSTNTTDSNQLKSAEMSSLSSSQKKSDSGSDCRDMVPMSQSSDIDSLESSGKVSDSDQMDTR